jgi:hypothetical protein
MSIWVIIKGRWKAKPYNNNNNSQTEKAESSFLSLALSVFDYKSGAAAS